MAKDVTDEEFENLHFEPPLRVLKTLNRLLKERVTAVPNFNVHKINKSSQTDYSTESRVSFTQSSGTQITPNSKGSRLSQGLSITLRDFSSLVITS